MPNDEGYGDNPQSTGLQYLIYLDKYYKGLGAGPDFTTYGGNNNLSGAARWDNNGFNRYATRALLGVCEGANGPHQALRKGTYYLNNIFVVSSSWGM